MYRSIMVGYDGSEHAKDALALAQALSAADESKLILARVFPWSPWTPTYAPAGENEIDAARDVEAVAKSLGAEAQTASSESPARGLSELAEELGVELVVVGSSHRGPLGRAFAGTVARGLLRGASCAVAVAPAGFRHRERALDALGVALDGSPEAQMALNAVIELADRTGASVRVMGAIDPVGYGNAWGYGYAMNIGALREQLEAVLADAVAEVPEANHPESRLLDGHAATAVAHASEDLDVLFMGSRGYGPLRRVLLGSVSSELVESAPCAVLVCPRGTESAPVEDRVATVGESA